MRFPDLLATRRGRLAAFFFMYMTEGIPVGFSTVALTTQMHHQGYSATQIGFFSGTVLMPWAWKWAIGPFVDTIYSERHGRRRLWIIATQVAIVLSLLACMGFHMSTQLYLFMAMLTVANACAATQDVAIDALAVGTLPENELGLANGFMFAGQSLGIAGGGGLVLVIAERLAAYGISFSYMHLFVGGLVALVTIFVVLPMREPHSASDFKTDETGFTAAVDELRAYGREAWKTFRYSRVSSLGLLFAIIPIGSMALAPAFQQKFSVALQLTDKNVGLLAICSNVAFSSGCLLGGWLADRYNHRRMLVIFVILMALPDLILAHALQDAGWIRPDKVVAAGPSENLLVTFWIAAISYNFFEGMMYPPRNAIFMSITNPAVAATQFTAYMAILNIVISYSQYWQGWAMDHWGYAPTLIVDGLSGLLCLLVLPFMRDTRRSAEPATAP